MDWKKKWKKFWHFIWHEDSLASWVANVVLAFVLIKFLVYPALGALFGTSFPIVAVVSESMEHNQDFNNWWEDNKNWYLKNNVTKNQFEYFPFTNGFNKGDIMVLIGDQPSDIKVGDVVVYQAKKPYPIIHRVVDKEKKAGNWYFETKGDNNENQIVDFELDETNVHEDKIYGKAVVRIPYLGYVKIGFVELLQFLANR